jgi:hypothetical protein
MGYIYWTDSLINGDNVTQSHITTLKNDITSIINGGLTNINVNSAAAIVESKISFNTSTGHNHDGSNSRLVGAPQDMIARGFELGTAAVDDTTVTVLPGVLYHGTTKVSKTSNTTLTFAAAADWYDGSTHSYAGGAGWCYIGVDSSGNIKLLHTNAPDKADTSGNTAGTLVYYYYVAGTTYYRVIGAVRMDTDNKIKLGQYQEGNEIIYDDVFANANFLMLNDGAAAAFAAVSAATFVPDISTIIHLDINTAANDQVVQLRPTGSSATNGRAFHTNNQGVAGALPITINTNGSQSFDYLVTGGTTTDIYIVGYKLNIR